jgi:hypothetical protein
MSHRQHMVHTRLLLCHHWHLNISSTVASRCTRNRLQMSERRKWQPASLRGVLQIASQPDISCGVQKSGNHWAPYCQQGVWLVTALRHSLDPPPSDFQLLGLSRSTWLASDLQQTPTWSKLLPPAYRYLNVSGDYVEVWCVPSATYMPGICPSKKKK